MTIQKLSEAIKQGKNIRINNYLKPKSNTRSTEEVVNVIIDCSLEPYDQLLRKSKSKADQFSQYELKKLQTKFKATVDDTKKALTEIQQSLAKRVNSPSEAPTNKNLIYHTSYFTEDAETGYLYFRGQKVSEQVIKKGSYKKINSKPKTLIKNEIRKSLPNSMGNWKIHKTELDRVDII